MSIAIVSETRFLGSNNAVSARVWNYAQAMHQAGKKALLLSYGDYCFGDGLVEVKPGIWGYAGKGEKKQGVKSFLSVLTSLIKEKQLSAILFYPTPNPIFEFRFLLWKKRMGFENVFCEVNEVRRFEQSYLNTFSLPKRLVYGFVTKNSEKFTKYYKGLICISKIIKQYFDSYNSYSIVVPILSDIPEVPTKKKSENNLQRFVFTGTVAIEKENLAELIRGFFLFNKDYTNWEFLLYGRMPEANRKNFESMLDTYGLSDKIHLMGETDHSHIHGILSEADCLILPRRNTKQNYYGFSTKLSEYAVSGTPIILTETGVVFDYFQDGKDCLKVKGYDAEDFYEQLKRFATLSPEQKDEISQNAYMTAMNHFDWRLYSELLIKFLNS